MSLLERFKKLNKTLNRVTDGSDSVLKRFIETKFKSRVEEKKESIKVRVQQARLVRLNKKLNEIDKSLQSGTGLLFVDRYLEQRKKRIQERRDKLKKSKLLKPVFLLKDFSDILESIEDGDFKLPELPLIAKIGISAVVVNVMFDSVKASTGEEYGESKFKKFEGKIIPQGMVFNKFETVDWSKYAVEVSGIKYKRKTASGVSINNPMNVRPSSYEGQIGKKEVFSKGKSIGYFAVFSDPYYSFKAAARQILRYRDADSWEWKRKKLGASKGNLTVFQMLNIYAPPEDMNNPSSYANSVMRYSEGKIHPNDLLKIDTDKEQFKYLLRAMARIENAAIVDLDYLDKVWESIYGSGTPPLHVVNTTPTINSVKTEITTSNRIDGTINLQENKAAAANKQS